jgi:hypothetical protein
MSTMIGVGPFITIPVLMAAMGGPQAMLGWVVALVIACSDGLVWSELGAMMPGSGGSYVYLRDAFGPEKLGRAVSFLFIWQFLLSGPLEIASGYIGFARQRQPAADGGRGHPDHLPALPAHYTDWSDHDFPVDRHAADGWRGHPERSVSFRPQTGV